MSILIKGMEMPKGRPVCIVIDAAGQARRYDLNNDRYADDKLFEAVPVPPHGDLIERKVACNSILEGMVMTGYQSRALDCISEFYVPTIIPADPAEEGET